MTHFGLICPTGSGHLNPMTTLGYELRQRGHRVTVISLMDAKPKTLAAGLEFQAIGELVFPEGAIAVATKRLGQLKGIAALQYTVALFQQVMSTLMEEAPAILHETGVEALLLDQTASAGSTLAEYLDLPFVSVCCAMMLNADPNVPPFHTAWHYHDAVWARLRNQLGHAFTARVAKSTVETINRYRRQWKLPLYSHLEASYSHLAQIAQQPAEFEFPRQNLPDCFHFTGSFANPLSREPIPFPYEKLTGQPLIYASLGTIQNRLLGTFQTIAQACEGLDAQLVIALGGGSTPEALPSLPGSPILVENAPQLDLLKRASLTITHAGLNTTLESLSNGVPMVAIPIANDQPGVAARIAWTGTGKVVALKGLSVPKLRRAIQNVLTQDSYKQNAVRLQAAIQQSGGVKRAADIVEQVIATGKPVLRQSV